MSKIIYKGRASADENHEYDPTVTVSVVRELVRVEFQSTPVAYFLDARDAQTLGSILQEASAEAESYPMTFTASTNDGHFTSVSAV